MLAAERVIGAACELGIPERLARGPCDASSLATDLGTDPDAVHRLLRAMVALRLCEQGAEGRFGLTDDGALLVPGVPQSLGAWARMSAARLWDNWGQLAVSVRTGASARSRREGADDFSDLDRDASLARQFNAAMVDMSRPVALAAARELDWSHVGKVVDVGGGAGIVAAMVVLHHAGMEGIVYDLPHAAGDAATLLEETGVAARCRFQAGSFFDAVPSGADAYVLKSVVHNWNDEHAAAILRRCREAMAPGGRVVLLERVLIDPPDGSVGAREAVRSDLNMLVGCGGRERTVEQFRALLEVAGLYLRDVRLLAAGFSALTAVR